MKRYVKRVCCAIAFALCGCDSASPATVGGEVGAGGECVGLREQGQTCLSDCDCAGTLECAPCVSTAERNCADACEPNDPYCNNGTATCPIGDGLPCESVTTCQAPAFALPCTTQADCYFDPCTESTCVDGQCAHALYPDGSICIGVTGGQHFGGMCSNGVCVQQ